jgi:hypothetical protein
MKKSKVVNLVLVAGLLASCQSNDYTTPKTSQSRLYMRGDTVSRYNHSPFLLPGAYLLMRSFGYFNPGRGGYVRTGYQSPTFAGKATSPHVTRGGFGSSGVKAGS